MAMTPVAWKLVLFEFMIFLLLNFVPLQPIAATQKGECSYTLEVITSRWKLSLTDGAGTKNPVHVKLQDRNGTSFTKKHLNERDTEKNFKPGKTSSFNFSGPCLEGNVCLLNFMVDGEDGWKPWIATVNGESSREPDTFYFGHTLPPKAWDGPNKCNDNEQVASYISREYKPDDQEEDQDDNKRNNRRCLKARGGGKRDGC